MTDDNERDWLDEGQPTVVERPAHVEHRVVGPPGCGKTTYLVRQVVKALGKYLEDDIAICSLTRAAAAAVAGAAEKMAAELGIQVLLPRTNIGTLHAFAYRALDHPVIAESPEGIAAWNEACGAASWRLTGGRVDTDEPTEVASFDSEGDELLAEVSMLRARMVDERLWRPNTRFFSSRWEQWKAQSGYRDFTDLIVQAIEQVDTMPGDPKIIMLDEAQDLSTLEMTLARKWGQACEQLVIVGDPDQALYTWRGADPHAVFGDDPEAVIVLEQSYRVPKAVHHEAVRMIERIPQRLPVAYQPRVDEDGIAVLGDVQRRPLIYKDPEPVVSRIEAELDAGARDVMALTTCGYMLGPLLHELRQRGIPFHNPYRTKRGDWNPMGSARRLLAFLRPNKECWGAEQRMWSWEDLRLWTDPLVARGNMARGAKTLIEAKCRADQFGNTQAHTEVAFNTMLELFEPDVREHLITCDVGWWRSQLRAKEVKRLDYSIRAYHFGGGEALRTEPKVIVGTIHSVKGGEADSVLLFPDLSTAGYHDGLMLPGEPHDSVIRQFFVGMTRARERLILCEPSHYEHIAWS